MSNPIFKENDSGRLVEVERVEDGRVYFFAVGGGFGLSGDAAKFYQCFTEVKGPLLFRPFLFSGDWLESNHTGYSDGRRWNGWAIPYVTKEVLLALLTDMEITVGNGDWNPRWEGDTFILHDPQEKEDIRIEHQTIETEDGPLSLYEISLGWCWDFVDWVSDVPADQEKIDPADSCF